MGRYERVQASASFTETFNNTGRAVTGEYWAGVARPNPPFRTIRLARRPAFGEPTGSLMAGHLTRRMP